MTKQQRSFLQWTGLATGAFLMAGGMAFAQSQGPSRTGAKVSKPKIDVVFSLGAMTTLSKISATDSYGVDLYDDGRSGSWLETARYESKGTPIGVDVSAAVYPIRNLGLGVGLSSISPKGNASLTAHVEGWPQSRGFAAKEGTQAFAWKASSLAFHVQLRGRWTNDKTSVEVFAGPTFFSGKFSTAQKTTGDFSGIVGSTYTCWVSGSYLYCGYVATSIQPTAVTWGNPPVTTGEQSTSKVGVNVGVDFTRFFTKNIGIGCQVRYTAAKANVPGLYRWNPDTATSSNRYAGAAGPNTIDVKLGGAQVILGIRFKL
jgi:hypothetical protein